MKKNIEGFIKILIYITFFVPLVVLPGSFIFPFVVPKILLFRSLITIVLVSYVLLLVINYNEYKPKFTWLNVVLSLFFLSFFISTFSGVDWYHSFWDNHERMLGLFTIFHYVVLYFVSTVVFKNWKEWRLAFRIFLIAGSMVMLVGLFQVMDPYLLLNRGESRVSSTLGNSIYVGGYGLFLTFVSILLVLREKNFRGFWFYAEILMGLISILGAFFSGSRGSMLGLLAGLIIMLLGYIIVLKDNKKIRKFLISVAILMTILVGILVGFRKTSLVKNLPAIGRTVNTSLTDVKDSARWLAWGISVVSWKEMPIFGWGPNNYFYAFNKNYNPKLLEHGYGETWFDNAHNIIMNTLAVQGTFGILVYLSIFGVSVYVLIRSYKKERLNKHITIISSSFLIAHLIQNITVFENPTSYLYFMIWLAFVNSFTYDVPSSKNLIKSDKNIGYGSITTACVFALLIIFIFNIQPARANNKSLQAIRILNSNPILAVGLIEDALEFNSPHIDDIRSDIARNTSSMFNNLYKNIGKEKSAEILDLVYNNLKKNLILHPLDIRNQMTLSQLARLRAAVYQSVNSMLEAEALLKDALSKSSKRQQIMYNLASIKMDLNKGDEAIKLYQQAIKDNYVIAESYWRLAHAYNKIGQPKKAIETIDLISKNKDIIVHTKNEPIINQVLATASTTINSSTKK
jgi:hypothetical protein